MQGEALRQGDDDFKSKAEQFIKLIELEWTTHVIQCSENPFAEKLEQPPNTAFVRRHQKAPGPPEMPQGGPQKKILIDQPSQKSLSELSQVTLAQLILFNRHREGEVSRMEQTLETQTMAEFIQGETPAGGTRRARLCG